ncbi:hypothetical protein [Melittangium boletus]|uniref:Uncharacterized protein n=1 Tax=Melittangium boletus DSM 14713 TaxID=1294270 RepID=A0A250ISW6_9BACT|nr:hypothetical protein [Melittangium boletus]ATB34358.1 hypothetical protein MEBOL_007860 [Melittangium boletus DSM 14713]
MRTSLTWQARHPALARDKAPLAADLERMFGSRSGTERPASIRDAIVRWLNEEL